MFPFPFTVKCVHISFSAVKVGTERFLRYGTVYVSGRGAEAGSQGDGGVGKKVKRAKAQNRQHTVKFAAISSVPQIGTECVNYYAFSIYYDAEIESDCFPERTWRRPTWHRKRVEWNE